MHTPSNYSSTNCNKRCVAHTQQFLSLDSSSCQISLFPSPQNYVRPDCRHKQFHVKVTTHEITPKKAMSDICTVDNMTQDTVLVMGGGGREHALAWKLAQSSLVKQVLVSPGNAGTEKSGKISNADVDISNHEVLADWCKKNNVDTVVVGPEDPLAKGIADTLSLNGVPCFGPSAMAAKIEASKCFAKAFMSRHEIPTARWKSFTCPGEACEFINSSKFPALVVKASGLAAGKGVIVAETKKEACKAVTKILEDKVFGASGSEVVVEELLEGPEISVSESQLDDIKTNVVQKTIDGMRHEGYPYKGLLYVGLMLTEEGPKVLEFNCRFGDPETQVVLPLLRTDFYEVIKKCINGNLGDAHLDFHKDLHAVAVVTVSRGYPASYKKSLEISGLDEVTKSKQTQIFHAGTRYDDNKLVTSGGRVLAVVGLGSSTAEGLQRALLGVQKIHYTGKQFRSDIGHAVLKRMQLSYSDSGVDISAGENLVVRIKPAAAATARAGCNADLGGFGGCFDLKAAGYKDPLLVSGTDGVGTKLKIAQLCDVHSSVGIDLVAMCVNDILCHGAEPLYFLDYFGCGKLEVGVAQKVIEGIADGCKLAGCALLGGETAEMPGMYPNGEYDLAGFAVGAVERELYLPQTEQVLAGDLLIGLPSSGLHSNGLSLVRRVVEHCGYTYDMTCPFDDKQTLGEALLMPTTIYVSSVLPVLQLGKVKAVAHITGGGLPGNVPRILPKSVAAKFDASKWKMSPVFKWLYKKGNVAADEMASTFNCGIGLVLVVSQTDCTYVMEQLKNAGEQPAVIGEVTPKAADAAAVVIENLQSSLEGSAFSAGKHRSDGEVVIADKRQKVNGEVHAVKRVAVLISGSGTNLQSLIDHTKQKSSHAEISLVISNKDEVLGLKRAEAAGIPTKVISHKEYSSRDAFDEALHSALVDADIDIVCLAGFMRILTGGFVRKWTGRMLNVHPSLLPSFKGANAHKLVLEAKVRISGCSVHFVAEEVDGGAILVQESVPVLPGDTEETLAERVKGVEHKAFPRALDLVASGRAKLNSEGYITWSM